MRFLLVSTLIAVSAQAAAPSPERGGVEMLMQQFQSDMLTRVEYCLRNVPEMRDDLIAAHQSFIKVSTQATVALRQRFAGDERRMLFPSRKEWAELALKNAHNEGYQRVCPAMLTYLRTGTVEGLVKELSQDFDSLSR